LEHGEGADGAATNFRPFNFLVCAHQIRLHCKEKNLNIEGKSAAL